MYRYLWQESSTCSRPPFRYGRIRDRRGSVTSWNCVSNLWKMETVVLRLPLVWIVWLRRSENNIETRTYIWQWRFDRLKVLTTHIRIDAPSKQKNTTVLTFSPDKAYFDRFCFTFNQPFASFLRRFVWKRISSIWTCIALNLSNPNLAPHYDDSPLR